ncbi:hypothetical protein [Chryseobacterium joostei]|uniref:hypothetical protein n=1 Tax=Chryseobacterium joostei TaxID=112234 RepID=UPI0023F1264D|nr:hypothetical protein [Chryseobacterium joostei]
MKKIFYFLLGIFMLSCSSNEDIVEETPIQISQADMPEKGYIFYTDSSGYPLNANFYYKFRYTNGNLTKISGTFISPGVFTFDDYASLSYENDKVKVINSPGFAAPKKDYALYTMENNKPVKVEFYVFFMDQQYHLLNIKKSYTYEKSLIKIYENENNGVFEYFTTYYFNNDNNLIKKEVLQKQSGIETSITTTIYSDFDNAKNPFKKMGLVNEELYEKSLSTNNFRKKEYIYKHLIEDFFSYTASYNYTYKYDSNGQVLLYHPL